MGFFFSLFMVNDCSWRGRPCFGRGGDRGFVMYISLFSRSLSWWVYVCVLVFARTHTKTTWVLDVSPGVGRTPREPKESRLTKVQCTYRPYMFTQFICLYICWAEGFDDLS